MVPCATPRQRRTLTPTRNELSRASSASSQDFAGEVEPETRIDEMLSSQAPKKLEQTDNLRRRKAMNDKHYKHVVQVGTDWVEHPKGIAEARTVSWVSSVVLLT